MTTPDARLAPWLDLVSELLLTPLTAFPHTVVRQQLFETFDVVNVSWNWREPNGTHGFELERGLPEGWVDPETDRQWHDGDLLNRHPLIAWFGTTGDPASQSKGRVPYAISPLRDHQMIDEILTPVDCDAQMSIPYWMAGVAHRAFVLARPREDFTDDDLAVARTLQKTFAALHRHTEVLGSMAFALGPGADCARLGDALAAARLTPREAVVLHLLLEGRTAAAIARRLGISPRTVHKHLENAYRKLGVADRLGAARAAAEMRLATALLAEGSQAEPGRPAR